MTIIRLGGVDRRNASFDGVSMLPDLPFLISTNSFGIIALLIFIGSAMIFTIPMFATRGGTQVAWAATAGVLLLIEAAGLITLVVLVHNGTIWQNALAW
jgi:hypothetical protein